MLCNNTRDQDLFLSPCASCNSECHLSRALLKGLCRPRAPVEEQNCTAREQESLELLPLTQHHTRPRKASQKEHCLTDVNRTSSSLTAESASCALSFTRLQQQSRTIHRHHEFSSSRTPAFPFLLLIESLPSSPSILSFLDLNQTPTQPKASCLQQCDTRTQPDDLPTRSVLLLTSQQRSRVLASPLCFFCQQR